MSALLKPLDLAPHAAVPADQVHLTLQFIGDTPARDLERVLESARRAAAGTRSLSLSPRRLITLPDRGVPRLVAVQTDAPPVLVELHHRLAQRLASKVRQRPGGFCPHLTLCRFRHDARSARVDQPIAMEPFPLGDICVVKSTLRPTGAVHEIIESIPLE